MAIVRAHVETVEVIGLDEAYLELTGLPAPHASMRRVRAEIERADRPAALDRDRPQQARGQGRLRRREAARVRGPDPRAGVRAVRAARRAGWSPGSVRRPPSGCARSASTRSASSPPRRRQARRAVRAAAGVRAAPARAVRGRRTGHPGAQGGLRIAGDDVRFRPRDQRRLEEILQTLVDQLCATLTAKGRGGRTVGIKVRLDDFSTHTRARTLAEPVASADRVGPVALDLLRRFAAPRPVRLLGVRVAGLVPAASEADGSSSSRCEQAAMRPAPAANRDAQ